MSPRPPPPSRVLVGVAIATVLFFGVLVGRFWHPVYGFTAFFQLDASNDDVKLEPFRDLPVYVYRDTGGYDGLYYAQLALDPALRDPHLAQAMDNAPYRARRILPSALAWLAGAGTARGAIFAYSVLNVVAWLALALLLWRILEVRDAYRWAAWAAVLFSAGALCSVRLALTDLPATTLIAGGLLAAETYRKRTALIFVAAAGLARETALLSVAGLVKAPWGSFKNAVRIALVVVPLAGWLAYVRLRLGGADQGWGNFALPGAGYVEKWQACVQAAALGVEPLLAWTTLAALIGVTAQVAYLARIHAVNDRWWRIGAAYSGLMLFLGTAVWEGFPGAATRVLLPLTLAFNVVATRRRAAVAWLVAGNLGVLAGLLAVRDVPRDPTECASFRSGTKAAIVHLGRGWDDTETAHHHHWNWAATSGTLTMETWPRPEVRCELQFFMRALSPRTVTVSQDGRPVMELNVTEAKTAYRVPLQISGGHAQLTFSSAAAPVRENATAAARALGFQLYDLQIKPGGTGR